MLQCEREVTGETVALMLGPNHQSPGTPRPDRLNPALHVKVCFLTVKALTLLVQ